MRSSSTSRSSSSYCCCCNSSSDDDSEYRNVSAAQVIMRQKYSTAIARLLCIETNSDGSVGGRGVAEVVVVVVE